MRVRVLCPDPANTYTCAERLETLSVQEILDFVWTQLPMALDGFCVSGQKEANAIFLPLSRRYKNVKNA